MEKQIATFFVNGRPYQTAIGPHFTLLEVLRDELGLTGTKFGCGGGDCGACTVLIEGRAVLSCLTLAMSARGKSIQTIEGLAEGGVLNPLQRAFVEHGAIQCGYCSPGMIMCAHALLTENPLPTEAEARAALGGNLCRCTGYVKIVEAVLAASRKGKGT